MDILFVTGPGRSGTTALTDHLNMHPEILVCRERYKFVVPEISPNSFKPENVLGDRRGQTEMPARYDARVFEEKDLTRLKWIGDKNPDYVKSMALLSKNNPGARFIVTYRPIEEVAESYTEIARNPQVSWLTGQDGFKKGVEKWNVTLRKTRRFIESCLDLSPNVLIVDYHDLFGDRQKDCVRLISRFLDVEFDDAIASAWEAMSSSFEERRRRKGALSEEQSLFLDENKDSDAEAWVLARMSRQWEELYGEERALDGARGVMRKIGESALLEKQAEEEAQGEEIEQLRRQVRHLRRNKRRADLRVSNLERRLENIHSSRTWRLLGTVNSIRAWLRKKVRRKP